MIVQCMNTIYGAMVYILLYYKKFVNTTKKTGFQINPHYPCVTNHPANNKQKPIFFHVDDFKLSHQDIEVNNEFINIICDEYESMFEDGYVKMQVRRGKLNDYLGINLYYSVKYQVKITMMDLCQGNYGMP